MKKIFTFLLAFSLVQLAFAQEEAKSPKTPIGGRPNIPSDLKIEFGFNVLNNRPEDMGTNFFGSRSLNVYYQHPINIFGATSGFTLDPGVGFGTDKWSFQETMNLFNDAEKGTDASDFLDLSDVYGDGLSVDYNKFALNYFEIPVDLVYHVNKANYTKGFRVSVGGKVGILYDAHTKIKFTDNDGLERKIKESQNYGLEKIRYGLTFKAGTPGFYVWSYFGLNNVFQSGMGPVENQAKQISFGVAVNLF
ncbi:porin family protein [Algoriphagus zhangzhouensis]|uniref:Outer membrane protein beta-barrel domain-containing protein n=1 Tax=Algoriphagus zhangzhouensis TaxID=1073327 RepID=A0A1M7ZEQ8_9BACT|nr:porin family protein [Algoriphagus zhangzhouensis]TDY46098.1 outer membrane protein with beta-barrel domain [Algoriphagus zhangzhouensis]SHO63363.1 Outer membrane protein beta-barrel domain-containing protein [Algoriphagus zhangzhouensis]